MAETIETSGIEKIYQDLFQQLNDRDMKEIARSKNLLMKPSGEMQVVSFARDYLVNHEGISASDEGPVSSGQKLAVISYLLSAYRGGPSCDFIPFSHLGGYNIGREKHIDKHVKGPILAKFGEDYGLFERAALQLGGSEKESETSDKHIWLFQVVPNLLVQVIFYEADEDFPADIQILFDSRALDILGMKCLGFLPGYCTTSLLEAAAQTTLPLLPNS